MRCLIGFFGLTRSLRHTAASIRAGFYDPLLAAGFEVASAGHFNLPDRISNPRSGEADLRPDRSEAALLPLDLCWTERQDDAAIAGPFDLAAALPDRFGDGGGSLANLCHQLRSLDRLWCLLEMLDVARADVVMLLRPDLFYVDPLRLADLAPLLDGGADWVVPRWQSWGGLNDRFVFATPRAARLYARRWDGFQDACLALQGMHSETFLDMVAQEHRLRVATTAQRAVRVRANGTIAANDLNLLPSAAAFAAPGAATARVAIGLD